MFAPRQLSPPSSSPWCRRASSSFTTHPSLPSPPSLSASSAKPLPVNKISRDLTLLSATLTSVSASAESKRLTEKLTPSNATLVKKRGGVPHFVNHFRGPVNSLIHAG